MDFLEMTNCYARDTPCTFHSRGGSSGHTGIGCQEVLQWGQDLGGTGTTAGYGMVL